MSENELLVLLIFIAIILTLAFFGFCSGLNWLFYGPHTRKGRIIEQYVRACVKDLELHQKHEQVMQYMRNSIADHDVRRLQEERERKRRGS